MAACKTAITRPTDVQLLHEFHQQHEANVIEENKSIIKNLGIHETDGFWVFGYGSLLWKVHFEHDKKVKCFIKGYVRRMWQISTDHRGTREQPGRVCTVMKASHEEQKLWGFAYHVPSQHFQETFDNLNFREKGGYTVKKLKACTTDSSSQSDFDVLLWIADEGNHNYGGDLKSDQIAQTIAKSCGPSGPNVDYLFNMVDKLREFDMYTEDDEQHILLIEKKVKEIVEINSKRLCK